MSAQAARVPAGPGPIVVIGSSQIKRSFVYPHRCTLPSQHAQHFQHLCKCVVLRQVAPC